MITVVSIATEEEIRCIFDDKDNFVYFFLKTYVVDGHLMSTHTIDEEINKIISSSEMYCFLLQE